MPKKLTYDEVKRRFDDRGCELLSTEYVDNKSKMKYRCVCGNIAEIALYNFSQGQLCYSCGRGRGGNRKHTLESVRKLFDDQGCTLLAKEYVGPKTKMEYTCQCGNHSSITLSNFMHGRRCQNCRIIKLFGERPDGWAEESLLKRKSAEYAAWRKRVLRRDGHQCVACGEENTQLHVHHIESFMRRKDLRTVDSNGVTLCEDCHKEYHRNFYWNDADEETFFEFMFGEYREPWYAGEVFDD